jgi:hypothetical protein
MPAAGAASGRARRGRGGDKNEGTGEEEDDLRLAGGS